jgi:DoxX-like family
MKNKNMSKIVTYIIATVWLLNGLICKVLNLVPRHQKIVARILGDEYSVILTKIIGFSEIMMGIWILSGILPRLNAWTQIIVVATMNILEFLLVPDLLLWGKGNSVFAILFILLVFYNQLTKQPV